MKLKTWYSLGNLFRAEYYLTAGDKEKSLGELQKATALFEEMGMDFWLVRTREVLEKL